MWRISRRSGVCCRPWATSRSPAGRRLLGVSKTGWGSLKAENLMWVDGRSGRDTTDAGKAARQNHRSDHKKYLTDAAATRGMTCGGWKQYVRQLGGDLSARPRRVDHRSFEQHMGIATKASVPITARGVLRSRGTLGLLGDKQVPDLAAAWVKAGTSWQAATPEYLTTTARLLASGAGDNVQAPSLQLGRLAKAKVPHRSAGAVGPERAGTFVASREHIAELATGSGDGLTERTSV